MNKSIIVMVLIALGLSSCKTKNNHADKGEIAIEWTDTLTGDYSFKNEWSYPEGVYRNKFGQLSCDGICPGGIDAMEDKNGKIIADSMDAFYRLVDTTHQFHSIQCDAWCYEWAGTDFISVRKKNGDTIECQTRTNAATHCMLHLGLAGNYCYPQIELVSIASSDKKTYACVGGSIKIGRQQWKQGILKAEFDFQFDHTENPGRAMFWKGKIYASVEKE
jgi:hypothetical protein